MIKCQTNKEEMCLQLKQWITNSLTEVLLAKTTYEYVDNILNIYINPVTHLLSWENIAQLSLRVISDEHLKAYDAVIIHNKANIIANMAKQANKWLYDKWKQRNKSMKT